MKVKSNKLYSSDNLFIMQRLTSESSVDFELHCHTMYEILYIIEGDIRYRIEGCEYTPAPESLLLIPPNTFHGVRIESSKPYSRLCIQFEKQILTAEELNILLMPFHQESIYYPLVAPYQVNSFMQTVFETFSFPGDMQELVFQIRIRSLLSQIYAMYLQDSAVSSSPDPRMQNILQYINLHLTEPLSLDTLASYFFISKNHLNVLFRKATGTTVNQYIRLKRLALAQQNLQAGCSLSQAALQAGFTDYSNFYKAYQKHYENAPSEYLKT
ncbi:MAG: AraC family transcriptional regulator [Lachnospiraceae bacterium]